MVSLITILSTCSFALIEGSYILNLYTCLLNFSGSGRDAFGLVDTLAKTIDQRKVISSRWRCTSACSLAIVLLIYSIIKEEKKVVFEYVCI